jgi:hypothetical protein
VALLAGQHPHRRSTGQPVRLDVPAGVGQHAMAGGRQGDGVRALRAGGDPERGVRRQAEQISDPIGDHVLRRGGRGRAHRVERHLIPAGGEHVGLRRGVERAADHEAEVARPRRRDQRRLHHVDQLVDYRGRVGALVRERAAERRAQRRRIDGRRHWAVGHGAPEIGDALGRTPQPVRLIGHARYRP